MMKFQRLMSLILILAPIYGAARTEDCHIKANSNAHHSDLIQAATIVGADDRKTEDEYAQSSGSALDRVNQAFAASGILNCGGFEQTAQITGKNNVITTAGHMFFDDNCNARANSDVSQCFFRGSGAANEKLYYVDASTLKAGTCQKGGHIEDWAVMKLTEAVEGVEPYRVPSNKVRFREGDTILNVSSFAVNFKGGNQEQANLNVCSIKAVFPDRYTPLKTDCDTGPGASGSAQFILGSGGVSLEPANLILSAINVAESKDHSDGADYNDKSQYNVSVPVAGKFYDALKAAMQ
jgi:aerobic-type carbon monoxide dehydrogenase small subunit (CoxS/CutS family)